MTPHPIEIPVRSLATVTFCTSVASAVMKALLMTSVLRAVIAAGAGEVGKPTLPRLVTILGGPSGFAFIGSLSATWQEAYIIGWLVGPVVG